MALAGTLLMMTIVLMLCMLMLSLSLYSSRISGLSTKQFERRAALENIGNDFLADYEQILANYVAGKDYKYYNPDGTQSDVPTNEIRCQSGDRYRIQFKTEGDLYTLTVKNRAADNVLIIECENVGVGGATKIELRSWKYPNA